MPVTIKKRWGQTERILAQPIRNLLGQSIGGKLERVVAKGGSSEEGLESIPSNVRLTLARASRSALVSRWCWTNPANPWQICRNAWTSSRMTVGSMALYFTAKDPWCVRRFWLGASIFSPCQCPDNEERDSCTNDYFEHRDFCIHRSTSFHEFVRQRLSLNMRRARLGTSLAEGGF